MKQFLVTISLLSFIPVAHSGLPEAKVHIENGRYGEAAQELIPLAEKGVPEAQHLLSELYREGGGLDRDPALRMKWLKKAADAGLVTAQCDLARHYAYGDYEGDEASVDLALAAQWSLKAAKLGDARCQYLLARMYQFGKGLKQDAGQAMLLFERAAKAGDAQARNALARMYYSGDGVAVNYGKALDLYLQGARQGDLEAQNRLAGMYYEGKGTEQSYPKAMEWYRRTAERGDGRGLMWLALYYRNGLHLPQHQVVSYALYTLSAATEHSPSALASPYREQLSAKMTPQSLADAENLVIEMQKPGNLLTALDTYLEQHPVQ